jgi:hypothetical protein
MNLAVTQLFYCLLPISLNLIISVGGQQNPVLYNQRATPFVLNNHISVQVAAECSGYSLQYLQRLLRNGKLGGIKIG